MSVFGRPLELVMVVLFRPTYREKKMNGGSNHWKSRLTPEDVVIIRRLYKAGFTLQKIARVYEYKPNGISDIVNYKTWKHVVEIVRA